MTDPRWTPVLKGRIYCSPACDGKCTKAQHDAAQIKAKYLAGLLGTGWEPHVWENLGWHACAKKGQHKVHQNGKKFTAYMNFTIEQWVGTGATPTDAVNAAINTAKTYIKELTKEIEELEK